MVVNQVKPKYGLRVECVGNRHDNIEYRLLFLFCKIVTTFSKFVPKIERDLHFPERISSWGETK